VDGQCDDIRCPDEVAQPSLLGLPNANAWPRFRHDNRNSGWTRAKVADAPHVSWSQPVGVGFGVAVGPQGYTFAGSETVDAGSFDCFDTSGNPVFSLLLGGAQVWDTTVPAVLTNGTSYVSTDNAGAGELWAVAANGAKTWTYPVPSVAEASPIVAHDGTLVYANDDHFYALDSSGNVLWVTDPGASGLGTGSNTGLAQTCDGHIYAGTAKGWRAIDIKTGASLWTVPGAWSNPVYGATTSAPVVAADGTLYGIDSEGVAWAVDASGNVLWRKPIGTGPYGERISSAKLGTMLLGIADGKLVAVDTGTGATVWSAPGAFGAGPIVDGNMRIYVNDGQAVYAFDAKGAPLWHLALGNGNAGPSEMAIGPDGTIYVQTFDSVAQSGSLWAIR
jgi:hypothetical protein